jgi:hypothetical protein
MDARQRKRFECFLYLSTTRVFRILFTVSYPMLGFYLRLFRPKDYRRLHLIDWGWKALDKQRYEQAETYAAEALVEAESPPRRSPDGNALHDGNQILGLVWLHRGDIEKAKGYLLEAGRRPAEARSSTKPHMILARELLQHGEKEVVLQYLDLVKVFFLRSNPDMREYDWYRIVQSQNKQKMGQWKKAVRAGKIPDDREWHHHI